MNNGSEINRKIIINYTAATAESRMFRMRCMCHGLWKQITSSFSSFFLHSLLSASFYFFSFAGSICCASFASRNAPFSPVLLFKFLFFNFRIQFGCAWFAIYGNSYRAHNELFNSAYRLWICKLRRAYAIRCDGRQEKKSTRTQQNNIEMEKPAKINQRHIVLYHRMWIVEAVYEFKQSNLLFIMTKNVNRKCKIISFLIHCLYVCTNPANNNNTGKVYATKWRNRADERNSCVCILHIQLPWFSTFYPLIKPFFTVCDALISWLIYTYSNGIMEKHRVLVLYALALHILFAPTNFSFQIFLLSSLIIHGQKIIHFQCVFCCCCFFCFVCVSV